MNPLTRFLRFNVVGAIGVVLQLAILAVLNRALPHRYLLTSTLAVELTILHNFAWHTRYTWPQTTSGRTALLRFHLSNGLVSIFGNLVLMHLFVRSLHTPVLLANALSITCCGLANFLLAHHWAFASAPHHLRTRTLNPPVYLLAAAVLLSSSHCLLAQPPSAPRSTLPEAPSAQSTYQPSPSASYLANVGILCGAGASTSSVASKPTAGCGVGMTLLPLPIFFELGLLGPHANRSYLSGYVSIDANIPLAPPSHTYLPLAFLGYSRLFETGHALDYGLALALPRPGKRNATSDSMRIELRDVYTFANPAQHNVSLRFGLMSAASD